MPVNDSRIDDMVDELEAFDWVKLRQRLKRLNQRDRAGSVIPDGYASKTLNTDVPANDPEALTPVERTADVRGFAGVKAGPLVKGEDGKERPDGSDTARLPERDPVHEANVHALSALSQAVTAVDGVVASLNRGEELQRWEKPAGHQAPQCRSEGCDGPAVARGWCDPCRKWISRNPTSDGLDPVTVPVSVIDKRTKRREKVA